MFLIVGGGVQWIEELEIFRMQLHYAFYGHNGGSIIGGVLRMQSFSPQSFHFLYLVCFFCDRRGYTRIYSHVQSFVDFCGTQICLLILRSFFVILSCFLGLFSFLMVSYPTCVQWFPSHQPHPTPPNGDFSSEFLLIKQKETP